MRILVHDYAGHAFPVQLSRGLADRGYDVVHLYAGSNPTPHGDLTYHRLALTSLEIKGLFLRRPIRKSALFRRWFQERRYSQLLANEIRELRPDKVISANTPLDPQAAALAAAKDIGAGFVFWLQDFIGIASKSILQGRLGWVGKLIGENYIRLEKSILRQSDQVVAITEDFLPTLSAWNIPRKTIEVIPNWAPVDLIPVGSKVNSWAIQHGLQGSFNFVYTGTLGMKHNPELLLKLAAEIKQEDDDARMVVISEGDGAEWLREEATERGISNILVLGFQPFANYKDVLASADVLVAVLNRSASAFSVPSKVLSYLCAARPLLLAVPQENLAARIVARHSAGLATDPNDDIGFARAARLLMSSEKMRRELGANARHYAEKNFDLGTILDRFEKILLTG